MVCSISFVHKGKIIDQYRWHILTAIGGYVAVVLVDLVTTGEVHEDPTEQLAWPIPPAARFIESLTGSAKQK